MKKIMILAIFIILQSFAFGQTPDVKNLVKEAEAVSTAFMHKDYGTLVDLTYPEVVDLSGGRESMIQSIRSAMEEMYAIGLTVKYLKMSKPTQVVKAGNQYHAVIPKKSSFMIGGKTINSKSYLLAITSDEGKHWYFIDSEGITENMIALLFPNFNNDLKLPKTEN